ncbi:hypothetical protein LCGC14_2990460, partial [marine sediment metagenome]
MSEGRLQFRGLPAIAAALLTRKSRQKQQDLAGQLERAEKERKNIDD